MDIVIPTFIYKLSLFERPISSITFDKNLSKKKSFSTYNDDFPAANNGQVRVVVELARTAIPVDGAALARHVPLVL